MYADMLDNLGEDVSIEPTPEPQPIDVIKKPQRQERSAEEIAAANKLRIQDRIDGKTTINGMVVGAIPKFQSGTAGVSPTVHKLLTGYSTKKNPMATSGLAMFDEMNEKSHQVNIDALIESEGKSGGAGMLYDPISNTFHGVTLSVKDMSEGTSDFVKKLTGSSTGKRRNFVGKVPDTAVYKGKVYNTLDAKDYLALMDAMEAEAKNVYDNHLKITKPTTDENQVDLTADVTAPPVVTTGQVSGGDPKVYSAEGLSDEAKQRASDAARDDRERERAEDQAKQDAANISDKQASEFASGTQSDVDQMAKDFGYNTGGFIGGMNPDQVTDAQTVADDYPIDSDDGDFMINAAAIEKDPQRFNEIISAGIQKAREKGIEVGDISGVGMDESGDVLASKGEFLVKKPLAETIGYDTLNQFNDQGKSEVDRRVAASGGFLDGYANGGEIDLPATRPSAGLLNLYEAIKEKFPGGPEPARKTTKEFLNQMSDEEALALTAITEASILGEKGLESVMHVVNNRINSDYQDFKSQFNVKDVLNRQTAGGAFQFTGLEIKGQDGFADLRTHVTELVTNPQAYRNYMKTVDMARDVLAGKRKDFTGGALFYYNPKASTSEDFKNKVADRTYVPIYYMRGKGSQHIYFSPQDIYRPELPVSRPETPAERIQKKSAQPSFLDDKVDLSGQGMFGTYLQNRPSLQY